MLCLRLAFASLRSTCTVAPVGTRLKVGVGEAEVKKCPDSFEKKVLVSLICGCQDERQPRKLAHAVFWNCKPSLQPKQASHSPQNCFVHWSPMMFFTPSNGHTHKSASQRTFCKRIFLWLAFLKPSINSEKFEKSWKHLPKVSSRDN